MPTLCERADRRIMAWAEGCVDIVNLRAPGGLSLAPGRTMAIPCSIDIVVWSGSLHLRGSTNARHQHHDRAEETRQT
jgi:hypothetical protein